MNFAIIGCGAIGVKRAQALRGQRIVACADPDLARAQALTDKHPGCRAFADPAQAILMGEVDAVVIATPHSALAQLVERAIEHGRHVLVEKPAARRAAELVPLAPRATARSVCVRVGFNHRYHRAFRKAKAIVEDGHLGPLLFLRARYGHGGRIGYEREWRADPKLSGGGELIDQGVHLIDLARWFLGEFPRVEGWATTYYWDMPVDDNAFLMLRTADNRAAFLHASCTEWKNTFSFELYGRDGKLQVDGLGGSYGVERLTWYRMLPEMGPPETSAWEFPMADDSWEFEMCEFIDDIQLRRPPAAGLDDAIAALRIVQQVYDASGYDHRA